jgi:MFS family permease
LLDNYPYPQNFALCFGVAFIWLMVSLALLALTREPARKPIKPRSSQREYWRKLPQVLRRDPNFVRFVISQAVGTLGLMGGGFLTVFAVGDLGVTVNQVGLLTAVSLGAQTMANAVLGLWGDRNGHKPVLELAALCSAGAMLFAWWARDPLWLYAAYGLAGIATAGNIISGLAIVLEFGPVEDRPTYIGLTNSLLAPFAGAGPLLGGWIVQVAGYRSTFATAAVFALLGWAVLRWAVRDPRRRAA